MLATLEIDFNCMGVLVPEERIPGVGTVHLFMPDTSGHAHPPHAQSHAAQSAAHTMSSAMQPHVVRMYHRAVTDPSGVDISGWALEIGGERADTTLVPMLPDPLGATVVDLGALSHCGVPRDLAGASPSVPLAARLRLGVGATRTTRAEATWRFGSQRVRMAHRFVWRIDGMMSGAELPWVALRGQHGPGPLQRLADMGADSDGVYRMSIYHVPASALPPDPYGLGQLNPAEVREHFRALYRIVGVTNPGPDLLPVPDEGTGGKVNCGIAQARFS